MRVQIFILWAALLSSGCRHRFAPLDVSALPPVDSAGDHRYELLLDQMSLRFLPGPDGVPIAEVTVVNRSRLLKGAVLPAPAVVYNSVFSQVVAFDARVVMPSGDEQVLPAKDKSDVPWGGTGFDDERVVRFGLPPLQK